MHFMYQILCLVGDVQKQAHLITMILALLVTHPPKRHEASFHCTRPIVFESLPNITHSWLLAEISVGCFLCRTNLSWTHKISTCYCLTITNGRLGPHQATMFIGIFSSLSYLIIIFQKCLYQMRECKMLYGHDPTCQK